MTVKHVWIALMLGAAVWGCEKNTSGTTSAQPPLATVRYFDAVPDTGYMDFRPVDIVEFAPNAVGAIYRNGGNPNGVGNGFLSPPYLEMATGAHDIRVFLDSTDLATASTVMFDTTVTFAAGHNYTFILYGSYRAKTLHSLVLDDSAMALPADNSIWVRTVNLGTDTAGLGPSVDAYVLPTASSPAAPPTIGGSVFKAKSAYVRVPVGSLQAVLTRTGDATLTPTASANFPVGTVGTSTVDPIAGSLVKNTAFTTVILPRVTPDTIASLTNVVDTVVVVAGPPAVDSTRDTIFATTSSPHHLLTGQKISIYGATPAAYNGAWTVVVVDATHLKFSDGKFHALTYTLAPATGNLVFEYSWKNYPNPGVFILIDQQPPHTAP